MYYIVGAGPTGLTCAHLLVACGKHCVVIEAQATVGGAHAVHRTRDGLFSEHGPRVYFDNYATFIALVHSFGGSFEEAFVDYEHSVGGSALALARHLSLGELGALATAFGAHLVAPGLYARTTVAEWMDARGFSTASRARLDQMCATVDGAGAARMTLAQLLEVLNQNLGYQIKQPRRANDVGVFADWKRHLERKHCEFWMEERVTSAGPTRLATSRRAALDLDPARDVLLLAVPPKDAHAILQLPRTKELADTSSYNTYIPITFHWHERVRVPSAWGGAKVTPWGLVYVEMSKYLEGEPTQTIVQASIAFVDRASDVTGKTANETPREADLVAEAWRQLGLDMPRYDVAIVSPRVWRGDDGRWHNADTAFMHTTAEVNSDARVHANVFVIGAHNRRGWYAATALEAACANAVSVMAELVPETSGALGPVPRPMGVRGLVATLAVVLVAAILVLLLSRPPKK